MKPLRTILKNLSILALAASQTAFAQETIDLTDLTIEQTKETDADVLLNSRETAQVSRYSAQDPFLYDITTDTGGVQFSRLAGGGSRPNTLVIDASQPDAETRSKLEEDLNVMARILGKVVAEKGVGESAAMAMGMTLRSVSFGGHSSAQNLYLDGYGAVFLLNVTLPLVAPPEPPKEEKKKEPVNTTWEEARRELYGGPMAHESVRVWRRASPAPRYDAEKVERLTDGLVEALKNAANIRHLKPGDFITITVLGGEAGEAQSAVRVVGDTPVKIEAYTSAFRSSSAGGSAGRPTQRQSQITIRVKKADVDAYAKGDLRSEQFRQKVAIASY